MLTRLLIGVNVIVYLWERTTGGLDSTPALTAHGALVGTNVLHGEWWRIITAAFLHGSDLHIIFNMVALLQVGTFIEAIFGTPRMALIYALSAVGSGLAVVQFTPNDATVGASGAIFGLFGALAAAGLRMGERGRQLVQQTLGIVIINLLIGFTVPNISNVGHIGGLITGFLFGLLLFRVIKPEEQQHADHDLVFAELIDTPQVIARPQPPPEAVAHEPSAGDAA